MIFENFTMESMEKMPLFTSSAVNPIKTKTSVMISGKFYHKIGTNSAVNNDKSITTIRFNGNPVLAIVLVLT